MTTIADIRTKFPQYKDVPDQQLADAFHKKYYSDMPVEQFYKSIGFTPAAPAAPEVKYDEPGFMQQMFDVKNPETGQSYLYGNKTAPAPYEDVQSIVADTASRGLWDKSGAGDAAKTEAARQRVPDYIEAPLDMYTAVASTPLRVAGTVGGAALGAGEGALNAYGHQDNWIPSWNDAKEIGWEATKGAGLGAAGAKAGEWLGKGWNWATKGKAPYSTPEELADAAANAKKRSKVGKDTIARNERMKQAELAQAEGPGGFQKLLADMDRPLTEAEKLFREDPRPKWPHGEKVAATKLANPPPPDQSGNIIQRGLKTAGSMAEGGGGVGKWFAGPLNVLSPLFKDMGKIGDVSPKHYQELQSMILDSQGRLKTDKATVDLMRNYLARISAQSGEGDRVPSPFGKRVSR